MHLTSINVCIFAHHFTTLQYWKLDRLLRGNSSLAPAVMFLWVPLSSCSLQTCRLLCFMSCTNLVEVKQVRLVLMFWKFILVGRSSLILGIWISMPRICFSLSSCLCKQWSLVFFDATWSSDPLSSKWTCICFLIEGKPGCFSMWILLVVDEQRLLFKNQGLFGVKVGIEWAIYVDQAMSC